MGLPMEDYIMCDRVMIAAPKSGSGKTFITCALLRALKSGGRRVKAFKCGPDYIDPMFHRDVLGVPSKNLDTFFTGGEGTRALFEEGARGADIAVMEGVMGLFDGLGGINEEGSSYHLAAVTDTPIVLVVDAKGMGRSVIALIAGFLKYDERKLIKGVILNRTSGSLFEILRPVMEEELGIRALGFLAERKEAAIESRHLGLMMPGEIADLKKKLGTAAAEFEKNVDLKGLLEIAHSAPDMECVEKLNEDKTYNVFTEEYQNELLSDFKYLYDNVIQKGTHVVIGEMGVTDKDNMPERLKYAKFYVENARKHHLCSVLWVVNYNRKELSWESDELIDTYIQAAETPFSDNPY